jgi:anti-sigma B factor antagonist
MSNGLPPLSVAVERRVRWAVVRVAGELDYRTSPSLTSELVRLAREPAVPRVCVDLARVWFCDSSGIASLLGGWQAIRARGGVMVLRRPRATLSRRVIRMGLSGVLNVVDDLPDDEPAER